MLRELLDTKRDELPNIQSRSLVLFCNKLWFIRVHPGSILQDAVNISVNLQSIQPRPSGKCSKLPQLPTKNQRSVCPTNMYRRVSSLSTPTIATFQAVHSWSPKNPQNSHGLRIGLDPILGGNHHRWSQCSLSLGFPFRVSKALKGTSAQHQGFHCLLHIGCYGAMPWLSPALCTGRTGERVKSEHQNVREQLRNPQHLQQMCGLPQLLQKALLKFVMGHPPV